MRILLLNICELLSFSPYGYCHRRCCMHPSVVLAGLRYLVSVSLVMEEGGMDAEFFCCRALTVGTMAANLAVPSMWRQPALRPSC